MKANTGNTKYSNVKLIKDNRKVKTINTFKEVRRTDRRNLGNKANQITENDNIPNTCSFVESRDAKVTDADMAAFKETLPENLTKINEKLEF